MVTGGLTSILQKYLEKEKRRRFLCLFLVYSTTKILHHSRQVASSELLFTTQVFQPKWSSNISPQCFASLDGYKIKASGKKSNIWQLNLLLWSSWTVWLVSPVEVKITRPWWWKVRRSDGNYRSLHHLLLPRYLRQPPQLPTLLPLPIFLPIKQSCFSNNLKR